MHSRRLACFLLGMWFSGSILCTWLISENSREVEHLLVQADPAATLRIKLLGPAETAMLMRYEAAELTRNEMALWGTVQLALGAFFLLFLLFGTNEGKLHLALALVLLILVAAQRFFLSPEIASLGKLTDFVAAPAGTEDRAKLLVMQSAYLGTEIVKWVMMLGLAAALITQGPRRLRRSRNQFNVIDKPDHRHIDR